MWLTLLAGAIYAIYHLTSFPAVPGGDSGELLAESCLLGTAHPPGYPLFTLLSNLVIRFLCPRFFLSLTWSVLSIDFNPHVAWQVNNFCCILGAVSSLMICLTSLEITQTKRSITCIGSFLFAFTPLVWEYSTTAEVFALNNLLCSLIIYLSCQTINVLLKLHHNYSRNENVEHDTILSKSTIRSSNFSASGSVKSVGAERSKLISQLLVLCTLGGLLSGLAISNQHSSLLLVSYAIPWIIIMLAAYQSMLLPRILALSASGFLVGLSPYFYLPWASQRSTYGSWGNMNTISGFLRHVLRSEYGTFQLGVIQGSETGIQRILIYLKHTSEESFHVIFPVLMLGIICIMCNHKYKYITSSGFHHMIRGNNALTSNSHVNTTRLGKNSKNVVKHMKKFPMSNNNTPTGNNNNATTGTGNNNTPTIETTTGNNNNNNNNTGNPVIIPLKSTKESSNRTTTTIHSQYSDDNDIQHQQQRMMVLIYGLVGMWLFYVIIWHFVLSNLPLSAPMPFAVHSRFWMQPNIILYILVGVSVNFIYEYIEDNILNKWVGGSSSHVDTNETTSARKNEDAVKKSHTTNSTVILASENSNNTSGNGILLTDSRDNIITTTSISNSNASSNHRHVSQFIQYTLLVLIISLILALRYKPMDHSHTGVVMHLYGQLKLQSLPTTTGHSQAGSLLLSHTDLDWNPVRYLQHCEGMRNGLVWREDTSNNNDTNNSSDTSNGKKVKANNKDVDVFDIPDVTHLSLQLIPYPWFPEKQTVLYPHVKFPPMNFPGVSTDRLSNGNAEMIMRFLTANNIHLDTFTIIPSSTVESTSSSPSKSHSLESHHYSTVSNLPAIQSTHDIFAGGTYIDMQAINEAEIGPLGLWDRKVLPFNMHPTVDTDSKEDKKKYNKKKKNKARATTDTEAAVEGSSSSGLLFIPWGTLYRIFGNSSNTGNMLTMSDIQILHHYSAYHLRELQLQFPAVNQAFLQQYSAGSWERAAANVYYDAHYQLGVNILTYCIEIQSSHHQQLQLKSLPILIDRLLYSAQLLHTTLDAVLEYNTFSSSLSDLYKNTALAWMRLLRLLEIVRRFRKEILVEFLKLPTQPSVSDDKNRLAQQLLDHSNVLALLTKRKAINQNQEEEEGYINHLKQKGVQVIRGFLQMFPLDRDAAIFAQSIK